MDFGQFVKNQRIALGYTARRFAVSKGYDVAQISRWENNITPPPNNKEKLSSLADALDLKKKEDRDKFFDLAATARNEIPMDLQSDENAKKLLPAFYRSLRKETLDEEEAKELLKLIEKSRKEN